MKKNIIDDIDRQILTILQQNGRTSNADIARKVGMAPSAILERVRKLESRGVIQGYEARIDPRAVDLDLTAFIFVNTEDVVGGTAIGERLKDIPEILEVHYTAGRDNYMVKARVEDPNALHTLLKKIGVIPGIRDTRSTIVLSTLKETGRIPLEGTVPGPPL